MTACALASRTRAAPEIVIAPDARAIVVQMGARRNYAIPAAFAAAGRLEALYTDLAATSGLGRMARQLARLPLPDTLAAPLARLGNRMPPPSVAPLTHSFDIAAGRYEWTMSRAKSPRERVEARLRFNEEWSRAMLRQGFAGATHVYAMMSGQTLESALFLEAARARGLEVVIDVTIALSTERTIAQEYAAHPGWGAPPVTYLGAMGQDNPAYGMMLALGTRFLCASPFVANDMIDNWGADPVTVRVEPYSFNPRWLEVLNTPRRGRVLFAGSADLRKGIHYFARAAQILHARGHHYEFRVAGNVHPEVRVHPDAGLLDFAGRLPRELMFHEFAEADVMVLPTLAEGSAGVTYEAMAAGVPTVTTVASGSLVEDGVHGHIIPSRDGAALANAIEAIVEDRPRRAAMSAAARAKVRSLSWDDYAHRFLVAALR